MTTLAAMLVAAAGLAGSAGSGAASHRFETGRTLDLPAGRAVRTFELHERSGVILLNRLVVPQGVRAAVDATIPHVAGVGVATGTAACSSRGTRIVCVQGEEGCPMPAATWRVTVAKRGGPAGAVRFDLLIAPPRRA